MKYVKQFFIIILITFMGEVLKYLLPFAIPSSIYGMVILFLALEWKVIKVTDVKECSKFLIECMPLMFIPAGAGLINAWDSLKPIWWQVLIITIISTILVMGVSGVVTQRVIRNKRKGEGK